MAFITLHATTPPIRLQVRATGDLVQMADITGGWQEITRPRRGAATRWDGYPAEKLTIPGMFDGLTGRVSVEPLIAQLERLAKPAGTLPPPELTVTGEVVPAAARRQKWVIQQIQWADKIVRPDGARVRQVFTIDLIEPSEPDLRLRVKQQKPTGTRLVPGGKKDTLEKIAVRHLKNKGRAKELLRLNAWARTTTRVFGKAVKVRVPRA